MNANMDYFNRVVVAIQSDENYTESSVYMGGKEFPNPFTVSLDIAKKHPELVVLEKWEGEAVWGEIKFDPMNQEFYRLVPISIDEEERIAKVIYSGDEIVYNLSCEMSEIAAASLELNSALDSEKWRKEL